MQIRNVVLAVAMTASWAALAADPAPACPVGEGKSVKVSGGNDEWTDTGMKVEAGDLILVEASGEVTIGSWKGKVGANGEQGSENGRLMIKVGDGGGRKVGAKFFELAKDAGPVKLKVYDSKYDDNDGAFAVVVTRVPAAALPKAATAAATP